VNGLLHLDKRQSIYLEASQKKVGGRKPAGCRYSILLPDDRVDCEIFFRATHSSREEQQTISAAWLLNNQTTPVRYHKISPMGLLPGFSSFQLSILPG
jgi:hypothetical protein